MRDFHNIIKTIADELGIKVTFLSQNWTIVLEKDHKIHYIEGHKFDINNHGISAIMDDKGLFHDLLCYKDIKCASEELIFKNYDRDKVIDYFNKHNKNIIVKGSIGTCGKNVCRIDNVNKLFYNINNLFLS